MYIININLMSESSLRKQPPQNLDSESSIIIKISTAQEFFNSHSVSRSVIENIRF